MSDSLLMLLEMIEEVLEEQSDSPHNFVRKVLEANGVEIAEKIKDKDSKGTELDDRITYRIESPDRQRLALLIGEELKKLGKAAIPIYSSDGSTIIGHKTKEGRGINFKYVLKPTKRYSNEAEKMELVIARASGNKSADVPEGFGDRVPNYEAAAKQIPGAPLAKLETQKLPAKGLYDSYGVQSGVPKTDLIGNDGKAKYSVKKAGGSQFVSAQGPESAALWHIALVNSVGGQQNVDAAVTNALNVVPDLIKQSFDPKNFKYVKDADTKDKAEIFEAFKKQLFDTIITKLGLVKNKEAFKKAFAMEGYSGQVKFAGGKGTANKVLTWSPEPTLADKGTVKNYVEQNLSGISIRVSDRGGNRGGAIRGEILNRPVQNESIVIEVVDDKEQEAVEAVKQFIEKYDLTTQELDAIQVELQKSLEERVATRTRTRLGPPLQGRPPRRSPATARRGSDENKKITADTIVLAKKFGPKVFNNAIEINKAKIAPTQKAKTAPTPDVSTEINGEVVRDRLQKIYDNSGIVKFLDALINNEEGGEINMRPLYEAALGKDVQFGDFEEPDVEMPPEGT